MIRLLRPGQRKTFRATFRLRANVTADTVTNGASVDTPTGSAPSPSLPENGRHPQAAATPARQGLRDDQGADWTPSLPGGAESPAPTQL